MDKKISIIIPSYNSKDTLGHTLRGLKKQTYDGDYEVIIADCSSTDEDKTFVKNLVSERVKVISVDKVSTPAKNRNTGSEIAEGEILAFIDSDAYPAEDWLNKIVESYDKGYKAGGGSVSLPEFQRSKIIASAQLYLQFSDFIERGGVKPVLFTPACNFYCGIDIFNKCGGFPGIRASEDVLLGLAINEIGQVYFIPDIKVFHIFRVNLRSFLKNQYILGKYILKYRKQYYDKFFYNGFFPLLLVPFIFIYKIFKIFKNCICSGIRHFLKFIVSLPLIIAGLISWCLGFCGACIDKDGEEDGR